MKTSTKWWHKIRRLLCKLGKHCFELELDDFTMDIDIEDFLLMSNISTQLIEKEDIIQRCIYCGKEESSGWKRAELMK